MVLLLIGWHVVAYGAKGGEKGGAGVSRAPVKTTHIPGEVVAPEKVLATERVVHVLRTETNTKHLVEILNEDAEANKKKFALVQQAVRDAEAARKKLEDDKKETEKIHQQELAALNQAHKQKQSELEKQKQDILRKKKELNGQLKDLEDVVDNKKYVDLLVREIEEQDRLFQRVQSDYDKAEEDFLSKQKVVSSLKADAELKALLQEQAQQSLTSKKEALANKYADELKKLEAAEKPRIATLTTEAESKKEEAENEEKRLKDLQDKQQSAQDALNKAKSSKKREQIVGKIKAVKFAEVLAKTPDGEEYVPVDGAQYGIKTGISRRIRTERISSAEAQERIDHAAAMSGHDTTATEESSGEQGALGGRYHSVKTVTEKTRYTKTTKQQDQQRVSSARVDSAPVVINLAQYFPAKTSSRSCRRCRDCLWRFLRLFKNPPATAKGVRTYFAQDEGDPQYDHVWMKDPELPHTYYSRMQPVWDQYGKSWAGAVRQEAVIEDDLLKSLTYRMYAKPEELGETLLFRESDELFTLVLNTPDSKAKSLKASKDALLLSADLQVNDKSTGKKLSKKVYVPLADQSKERDGVAFRFMPYGETNLQYEGLAPVVWSEWLQGLLTVLVDGADGKDWVYKKLKARGNVMLSDMIKADFDPVVWLGLSDEGDMFHLNPESGEREPVSVSVVRSGNFDIAMWKRIEE